MSASAVVMRIAAILAFVGTVIVVLLILLAGGNAAYTVTAQFENAAQLVTGNTVSVAGVSAGSVEEIDLSDDGQAEVKLEVSEEYAPLPEGTHATIRSQSLSGIANRYVDLSLPSEPTDGETISNGGVIGQANTTSEVDLDQLFNTLDEKTVASLKSVIKGFARSYDGVGPQANRGFYYLNPFLSTSRRVFGELNADQQSLESLIVDGASLTEALAERSPDLNALVGNLDRMMGAIGRQEESLASAIGQLPEFMRQFDTTAVNLRATLDDLDPLVLAARPVARKLQPFAKRLRGFAQDAVPTVKGLDGVVKRRGPANDLIELTRLQVPLAEIGVGPVPRNGASRLGALPESAQAAADALPQLSFFRPYITTEAITGWFDDFGHSGFYDAIGGIGRIATTANPFIPLEIPGLGTIPNLLAPPINLSALPNTIEAVETALPGMRLKNLRRCPGSNERGVPADQLTQGGTIDCDPGQVPVGP